jgi:hypothetical protein
MIRPRDPTLAFDDSIPRYWLDDNGYATHVSNGFQILFPAGERFFVRSVRHFLPLVDDPALAAQVRAFFRQEGAHAREHEHLAVLLTAQGFRVRPLLRAYERLALGPFERHAPPVLRLAVTAALEHFTTLIAEDSLRDRYLDRAHPTMRALLFWHAAEEIEHKSVAYDVLARVSPSYALRMAVLATILLGTMATFYLVAQDPELGIGRIFRERRALHRRKGNALARVMWKGIRAYARRDFHPSQSDNLHLANEYLAGAGLVPIDAISVPS